MIEITKDTIIGDILDIAPHTAPIFMSIGMHCLGCPASRGETVEQACAVHGVNVRNVGNNSLVAQMLQREVGEVEVYTLHEQICSDQDLFVATELQYGCIVSYTLDSLLVGRDDVIGESFDEAELANG